MFPTGIACRMKARHRRGWVRAQLDRLPENRLTIQTYISTVDASQQVVKEKHSPGKQRIG